MRWLDTFSGIGGFALGLSWAGFPPPVAFCECDPFCQRMLRKHWPDVPIHHDIRELNADAVGYVDLICGGFPCQPWSVAGQQRGTDDDRDLWPAMRAVVAACRPRWVLGENVPGLVSHELGLDRVLADLDDLGYASQAFCIPACAVDAPHIRDRVWIVAHAERIGGQRDGSAWRGLAGSENGSCGSLANAWSQQERPDRDRPVSQPDGRDDVGRGRSSDLRSVHPFCKFYSVCHNPNACDGNDCWLLRHPERAPDGEWQDDDLAHALGARPQERVGERGDDGPQRSAAERGRGVGDAERSTAQRWGEPGELLRSASPAGGEGDQRQRGWDASAGSGQGHWDNAEWLWCEFDQRWRRVEPGIRLLDSRLPQRVARLKALGNSVVPQVVAEIGRAILQAER